MKCVKGRVVSSHPISISKAARVLSRFVTSESGSFSSQAASAYLKRASASFNELVQNYKDLKSLRKSSKTDGGKSSKKRTIDETVRNGYMSEEDAVKGPTGDSMIESFDEGRKSERKKREDDRQGRRDDEGRKIKKKKRKDVREGEDFIDNDADGMKNERKRSEKVEVENVLLDSNETSAMKTEKRKKKKKAVD